VGEREREKGAGGVGARIRELEVLFASEKESERAREKESEGLRERKREGPTTARRMAQNRAGTHLKMFCLIDTECKKPRMGAQCQQTPNVCKCVY